MTLAKQLRILPYFMAVFFLLIGSSQSEAQQFAKINLKDRSSLKGNIVQGFDSTALILNMNGTITRLPIDNIKSIRFKSNWNREMAEDFSDNGKVIVNDNYPQYEPGFYHSMGIGLLSGNDYGDFSATMVNGYRFHPMLQGGIGVNYNRYEYITTVPIYAEYRGFPKKLKFSPYFFTQLGYGLRVEDSAPQGYENYKSQGGLYWGAGAGYQVNFVETALALSIGYSNQSTKTEYGEPRFWWSSTTEFSESRKMGRMDIKLSVIF